MPRAVRSYAHADKEPGVIAVQLAVIHQVVAECCQPLQLGEHVIDIGGRSRRRGRCRSLSGRGRLTGSGSAVPLAALNSAVDGAGNGGTLGGGQQSHRHTSSSAALMSSTSRDEDFWRSN
jgi:hypothetical protein